MRKKQRAPKLGPTASELASVVAAGSLKRERDHYEALAGRRIELGIGVVRDLFHAAGGGTIWPSAAISVTTKRSALTASARAASGVAPRPWQPGMSGIRIDHMSPSPENANIDRQRRHSFRSVNPLPGD
jgi:hypothetical protein